MEGIVSYKHLNEVALKVLKDSGKRMSANQINEKICSNYETNKLRLNPRKIGKRVSIMPEVLTVHDPRGINFYEYIG